MHTPTFGSADFPVSKSFLLEVWARVSVQLTHTLVKAYPRSSPVCSPELGPHCRASPCRSPSLYREWGGSRLPCPRGRMLPGLRSNDACCSGTAFPPQGFFQQSQILMLLFKLTSFPKRLLVIWSPGYCLTWVIIVLSKLCYCYFPLSVIRFWANILSEHADLGILFARTIYTDIPTVSSVVFQATLPRGGHAIPVQKIPGISPVNAEPVDTQTKLLLLHPVFILEIILEDFMCRKVNQV